jgi:hypothetical protein
LTAGFPSRPRRQNVFDDLFRQRAPTVVRVRIAQAIGGDFGLALQLAAVFHAGAGTISHSSSTIGFLIALIARRA